MRGFTIIELLIAIVIILIIAALAVPRLLHSRLAANEADAVASIKSINAAEVTYQTTYPTRGFAAQLSALAGSRSCKPSPASACLLDNSLSTGIKNGYSFNAIGTKQTDKGIYMDYAAGGAPVAYGETGVRLFCSMSDGVVRYSANPSHSTVPPQASQCQAEPPLE
jgi:type IV pilus assembly protein PilA